jgi:hypothetical protein
MVFNATFNNIIAKITQETNWTQQVISTYKGPLHNINRSRRNRIRMVVGFTTTYAI